MIALFGLSMTAQTNNATWLKSWQGVDVVDDESINWTMKSTINTWVLNDGDKQYTFIVSKKEKRSNGVYTDYANLRGRKYLIVYNTKTRTNKLTILPDRAFTNTSLKVRELTFSAPVKYYKDYNRKHVIL